MVSKTRPCTVFCADFNEVNHYITNAKFCQTSRLKMYLKILSWLNATNFDQYSDCNNFLASCLMSRACGLTTLQKRGSRSAAISARDLKSWENYFNTWLVLQLKFQENWRPWWWELFSILDHLAWNDPYLCSDFFLNPHLLQGLTLNQY